MTRVFVEHADCLPRLGAPAPHLPHGPPGLGADRHGRGRGQDRRPQRGGERRGRVQVRPDKLAHHHMNSHK